MPECAKRLGKGVRAARTICQWQIVRPERTARKRGAGWQARMDLTRVKSIKKGGAGAVSVMTAP